MSKYHCYLCASDDGLLLDIFGDGGTAICGKIETCLSVKVDKRDALSSKLCHKCAYELDACSRFIQKYRAARDSPLNRSAPAKGHCSLCYEPGRKGYIFDCRTGNSVNNSLLKIQELFDDSVFKDKRRHLSICLDCHYHLDVLFDLKSIYETTPAKLRSLNEKGLELSELPKTQTRVVRRKTTYALLPQLNGTEVYDTDSSSSTTSMMSLKRKRGRPRKDSKSAAPPSFRSCQQCDTCVENGIDMFRLHRTGLTVCKECWLATDPEVTSSKRKKIGLAAGEVGTRRCAIILKDVLTNPTKYENFYKVEKDEHGNTTFIVTDDSSENEEREKLPARRSRRSVGVVASVESTPATKKDKSLKRAADRKSTDKEEEPPEKKKDKGKKIVVEKSSAATKTRNGVVISDTEVVVTRSRRGSVGQPADSQKNRKASSDPELPKPQAQKRVTRLKLEKPEPAAASSSNETKPAVAQRPRRAAKTTVAVVSTTDHTERPVRRTRTSSLTSQEKTSPSNRPSTTTRSAKSMPGAVAPAPTRAGKSKSKSVSPKNSGSELELEKPYTCGVCNVEHKNKLVGMKHELTHAKQPEVKLQRVTIPEIIVEEASPESLLIEEPEEQSHDISSSSDPRVEDFENVEKVPREEASAVDVTETTETNENSEERKSVVEADVTAASGEEEAKITSKTKKVEDNTESIADEVEGKAEDQADKVEEKIEDKADKVEEEMKDKVVKVVEKTEDKEATVEDKTEAETNQVEDRTEAEADQVEDKTKAEADQLEDKTDKVEDKIEDKADIAEDKNETNVDKVEDKTEDKADKVEDKTEDKADKVEDKTEDKADKVEDKTEDKADKVEDKTNLRGKNEDTADAEDENEDEAEAKSKDEDETDVKDKNISKADARDDEEKAEVNCKTEYKTSAPRATEPETTAKDEECLENSVKNAGDDETNDKSTIIEPNETEEEKEKEKTRGEAEDFEKPESTSGEEVEKKVESPGLLEKPSEEVLQESTTILASVNGVNVEDVPSPKDAEANEVEKATPALDDAESKAVDVRNAEESVEPSSVALVTSTAGEQESDDKDVEENFVLHDDETPKDPEDAAEATTTEVPEAREKCTTKKNNESDSIANDVLTEVFDLATAEVQKRLENETRRDENCTTPVSETLENISREINSSADMPSLDPLVDDQSSNNQS